MKKHFWTVALLLVAVAFSACSIVDPPVACYDNEDWPVCEHLEMVCNMGVSLQQACQDFQDGLLAEITLPEEIAVPEACKDIPPLEDIGTCQPLGAAGEACAEAADCDSEICADGLCG